MQRKQIKITILLLVTIGLFTIQDIMANSSGIPVAMITSLEGKVSFQNKTDREIDFGTDIFIGDLIKTDKNSTISLTFYDGCRQEILGQQSLMQVGESKSSIRSGKFKKIKALDCKIPNAILGSNDSNLKAGLVVRGVGSSRPLSNIKKLINKNSFKFKAWTNKGKKPTFKLGDPILLHLVTSKNAYILINYYSSDGELYQLTPELFLDDDKINIEKLYSIGNTGAGLIAGTPIGTDYIHIIASDKPIQIDHRITKAESYHQALKKFIEKHNKQQFSEQQIKITITQ